MIKTVHTNYLEMKLTQTKITVAQSMVGMNIHLCTVGSGLSQQLCVPVHSQLDKVNNPDKRTTP